MYYIYEITVLMENSRFNSEDGHLIGLNNTLKFNNVLV